MGGCIGMYADFEFKISGGVNGFGIGDKETSLLSEVCGNGDPNKVRNVTEAYELLRGVENNCFAKSIITKLPVSLGISFALMFFGSAMMEAAAAIVVVVGSIFIFVGSGWLTFTLLSVASGELNEISTLYHEISLEAAYAKKQFFLYPYATAVFV